MAVFDTNTESRRQVGTRVVDRQWLFNNFYIGVVVLDVRPTEAVRANTLLNSVHVPPVANAQTMGDVDAQLQAPHRENFSQAKRFLREVVLVGDGTDECGTWRETLKRLLVDEGTVASVATLGDSFADFHAKYPFYTTLHQEQPRDAIAINRVIYPNEIEDSFLYLGNMWHAKSDKIVRDLGITHIVNATLDLGNVFEGDGVSYHEVKIPDQSDADIASYFDATFAFIDGVRAMQSTSKQFRVLVHCTQGISRSATLVIMYLMRAHRWSLVQAFNHSHRSRPVIIPNSGFFRALLADERRLFSGKNSLSESEIDALLQGRIEDRGATFVVRDGATPTPPRGSNPCVLM